MYVSQVLGIHGRIMPTELEKSYNIVSISQLLALTSLDVFQPIAAMSMMNIAANIVTISRYLASTSLGVFQSIAAMSMMNIAVNIVTISQYLASTSLDVFQSGCMHGQIMPTELQKCYNIWPELL